jgi:hypothetical protein
LLAPRPTPILEDQASVFISPRGRVATHFSRLLRHTWVMVGLCFCCFCNIEPNSPAVYFVVLYILHKSKQTRVIPVQ